MGIGKKITGLFISSIIILGIAFNFYFFWHQRKVFLSELDERAKALLNSLAASSEYSFLLGDQEMLSKLGKGFLKQKDIIFCEIRDKQSRILFQEGRDEEKDIKEYTAPVLSERLKQGVEEELVLGTEEKEYEEIGKISLKFSLASMMDKLAQARTDTALIILICGIFLSLIISLWIRTILGQPIENLIRGTKIIAKGDLGYRISLKAKDEIGQLANAFDEMAVKLKESYENLEEKVKNRTEQLEIARSDLQRSNKELEQFAYIASHDLQEPLRMVASYTQLLKKRYKDKLDERADKYIGFATDGAERMQGLIDDLLEFSRVGTKGKPFEEIDANSIFKQAMGNLEVAIKESGAQISCDNLPVIVADAGQMTRLFQNLIGNSVKFRGEKAPAIHVSCKDKGREWLFSISDNGIGIDPQYKERIFVIFQRLHTRESYPGTGMGLAICKKIVERHGGGIWMESKLGEGTTFYFTLPKVRQKNLVSF